ncbi:GNAT family N-acetyltransferase [Shimia sagamensis]|uniref:Acetyltransferase (GNAT) family protein n=1 Tax=Shimia sagamensis TaxID=1566352 RepID=A0ABY1P8D3_9RHOB|nr:GNAT family N-acetyltransferase [Shimia sagamensis]SMP27607.1 Acetyltransferase (GNAT) family protein [Shimia sagamensis]
MTVFRNATQDELVRILDWAAEEGWNPGLQDAAAFWQADPEGFFVAVVDGQLAAAISVVNHTEDFAFLGLYIARPAFRGQGIGYGLWQHALKHAGARVVGLDGVPDQQDNYAASEFELFSATTRFTGEVDAAGSDSVRLAAPEDVAALIDMEAAASGVRKPAYLGAWVASVKSRQTWVVQGAEGVAGFCTARRCREGVKIGPLWAQSEKDALALIAHVAAQMGGPVTLDVPDTSVPLKTLCQTLNLTPGFATARMYRGTPVPVGVAESGYFAVSTLELG